MHRSPHTPVIWPGFSRARTGSRAHTLGVSLAVVTAALGAGPAPLRPLGAQTATTAPAASAPPAASTPHDRSGHPFRTPAASAIEPASRIAFLHTHREGMDGWVVAADLGEQIPFWLHRAPDDGPALAAGVAAAAFSRFDLESTDNEFIEVHYRVGLRLRAALGRVAGRAELYHVSSHLGDEFFERTGRDPISTSREGIELLVQAAPLPAAIPGLLVYGGPGMLLRSSEDFDRPSFRVGLEWRGGGGSPAGRTADGPALYAASDAFLWSELDWRPMFSAEAGFAFGGGRYRVGLTFGAGPSRAEQFFRETETVAGIQFTLVP